MLSEQERKRVEGRLMEERSRATEALGDFDEQNSQSLQERTGELSAYRLHPADIGSESMEHEQQFMLASKEGERATRLDDALRRLYEDPEGFGKCRSCGADISMERLDLVPETELCAQCQEAAER